MSPAGGGAGGGKEFPMNIKAYQRGDVILGTYLVEDIRSGAMGNVYIAGHKKWTIKFAIKAPNEKIVSDKGLFIPRWRG
jgi:hypothetical protein